MNLNVEVLNPLVALIAGNSDFDDAAIAQLHRWRIYLIVIGILGLSHHYHFHI